MCTVCADGPPRKPDAAGAWCVEACSPRDRYINVSTRSIKVYFTDDRSATVHGTYDFIKRKTTGKALYTILNTKHVNACGLTQHSRHYPFPLSPLLPFTSPSPSHLGVCK